MALLRKSEPSAVEPYRVPSLAEVSPAYRRLFEKRLELEAESAALERERVELAQKIAADRTSAVSASAAALLGDPPSEKQKWQARLLEIRRHRPVVEAAIELARKRLKEEGVAAGRIIVDQARPEYRKRCAAVVAAAKTLHEARRAYDDLRDQFEAEDVQWTSLGPLTLGFLGDRLDGHLARLIKENDRNG